MKLIEITPKVMRCGIGSCPAIFETPDGKYVLIGSRLPEEFVNQELAGRISPGETAIEIPRELLAQLRR